MKISIVTLFPQMISGFFNESIIKRAQEKNLVEIEVINLRQYSLDTYGTVDERPYGGGAGMVMMVEPIHKALAGISKAANSKVILTSAKGKTYTQKKALELSQLDHLIVLAGHYEGFDERVLEYVDEEVSIGDFVLTGGEIVTAALVDSVVRLIPGVLKKDDATANESFFEVDIESLVELVGEDETLRILKTKNIEKIQLLEYPHYTRPEDFMGKKVPPVLMSGNHKNIQEWRIRQAYAETQKKRPDLLDK